MGYLRTTILLAVAFALTQAVAASPPDLQSIDVVMTGSGELVGHVFDEAGQPVAKAVVALVRENQEIERTHTNERGGFRFKLPSRKGGAFVLATANSQIGCRVWAGGTEPPSAKRMVLMTSGSHIRGQLSQNAGNYFGRSPWAQGGSDSLGEVIIEDGSKLGKFGCGHGKFLGLHQCCGDHCCGGCGFVHRLPVIALGLGIIYGAIEEDNAS